MSSAEGLRDPPVNDTYSLESQSGMKSQKLTCDELNRSKMPGGHEENAQCLSSTFCVGGSSRLRSATASMTS